MNLLALKTLSDYNQYLVVEMRRRTLLRTCGTGLALSTIAVGTSAAQTTEQADDECDDCGIEVLSETEHQKIVKVTVEDDTYRYRFDKDSNSVFLIETDTESDVRTQSPINTDPEILQDAEPWGRTIGEYSTLGITKYEAGVAATTGEDIGNAAGGAIGAAICAVIPIAGWKASAACGAIGSVVLDIDTDDDEFTVGVWDEAGSTIGTPYIRIGGSPGHEYSHEELSEHENVPGYLEAFDPNV